MFPYDFVGNGVDVSLAIVSGAYFGETALIEHEPQQDSAYAVGEADLLCFFLGGWNGRCWRRDTSTLSKWIPSWILGFFWDAWWYDGIFGVCKTIQLKQEDASEFKIKKGGIGRLYTESLFKYCTRNKAHVEPRNHLLQEYWKGNFIFAKLSFGVYDIVLFSTRLEGSRCFSLCGLGTSNLRLGMHVALLPNDPTNGGNISISCTLTKWQHVLVMCLIIV